jgi:hypothetical protein
MALCSFVRSQYLVLCAHKTPQYYGVVRKWLAMFGCLLMLDKRQIPNSGNFKISNVARPHP